MIITVTFVAAVSVTDWQRGNNVTNFVRASAVVLGTARNATGIFATICCHLIGSIELNIHRKIFLIIYTFYIQDVGSIIFSGAFVQEESNLRHLQKRISIFEYPLEVTKRPWEQYVLPKDVIGLYSRGMEMGTARVGCCRGATCKVHFHGREVQIEEKKQKKNKKKTNKKRCDRLQAASSGIPSLAHLFSNYWYVYFFHFFEAIKIIRLGDTLPIDGVIDWLARWIHSSKQWRLFHGISQATIERAKW